MEKNQFKVGDIVIGLPMQGMLITSQDAVLEVTEIEEYAGEQLFSGKLIAHKEKKYQPEVKAGTIYTTLPSESFKIATPVEIEQIKKATQKPIKEKPETTLKFQSDLEIKQFPDGRIESSFNSTRDLLPETDIVRVNALNQIIKLAEEKQNINLLEIGKLPEFECFNDILSTKSMIKAMNNIQEFFKEFLFTPNFRFINTLSLIAGQNVTAGKKYIQNYFQLTQSPYVTGIIDKMKSPEFMEILYAVALGNPSNIVNKRFKVYYGSQGTGKTTTAMKETEGRCIVCNGSMLPQDLMEDFVFEDGKPGFHPSELCRCMTEGKPIVLDEINLLNFESIRFLQGLLDGKPSFIYKGNLIKIKDGFQVIGTMNLVVNGSAFGLPEPLVDRASELIEYELTGEQLLQAIL